MWWRRNADWLPYDHNAAIIMTLVSTALSLEDDPSPIPSIWVLADSRPGTTNQLLGVAEALGLPYKVKQLHYNCWASLPNLLRQTRILGLDNARSSPLLPPYPSMVLSAGRRSAPVALWLQRRAKGALFLVHLMRPDMSMDGFDMVFLPEHDITTHTRPHPALHSIVGPPNRITDATLQQAVMPQEMAASASPPGSPTRRWIGVLLGGNTRHLPLGTAEATQLGAMLSAHANLLGASVMITTSRRTAPSFCEALEASLCCPYRLHRWKQDDPSNPYMGLLAHADILVVTGDSMSMCIDACSTGKPTYIYAPGPMLSVTNKYRRLHRQLYALQLARPLLPTTMALESWNYKPLRIADSMAGVITQQFYPGRTGV